MAETKVDAEEMRTSIRGLVSKLVGEAIDGAAVSERIEWLTDDDGKPMTRLGAINEGLRLLDLGYRFLPLSHPDNTPHEAKGCER